MTSLRTNTGAALAATFAVLAGPAQAETAISGLARTVLEDGKDQLPNLIVKAQHEGWTLNLAGDLYQNPQNKTDARLFFATLGKKIGPISAACGLQTPFFNNRYNDALIGALPPALSDSALTLNGGIVGCDAQTTQTLNDDTALRFQAYAGTKSKALSKDFGNPSGPGFGALVTGGGISLSHKFLDSGYRYTHFNEGPGGSDKTQHYGYLSAAKEIEGIKLRGLAEMTQEKTCSNSGCFSQTKTSFMAQASGKLRGDLDWRLAGGKAGDRYPIDAHLIWHASNRADIQLGGGVDIKSGDFVPSLAAKLSF